MAFNLTNNLKDKALFGKLAKEQVELFGTDLEYWTVERDEDKEKLYAEDTLPNITGKYLIKGYGLPLAAEMFTLSKFGFQSPDITEYTVSKTTFKEIVGDEAEPKWGDMVYIPYMERTFIVSNVIHEANIFLNEKFTYKLILNPADASGIESTSDYDENSSLSNFVSAGPDLLDDNDLINTLDDDVVVQKTGDSDPFADWN